MAWLFITLGLLTLSTALYALFSGIQARTSIVVPCVVLALCAAAWLVGHSSEFGWACVASAFAMQVISMVRRPSIPEVGPGPAGQLTAPEPEIRGEAPKGSAGSAKSVETAAATWSLTTIALLERPWDGSGEVFVASLRRGGARDAKLMRSERIGTRVSIGDFLISLAGKNEPIAAEIVERAAAQSWDWPEALSVSRKHRAQVIFTIAAKSLGDREAVVRLHCRLHAALAEFAPVVAVLWNTSERLVSRAAISGLLGMTDLRKFLTQTCVSFRTFALDGRQQGSFVCDTVGLTALGAIDLQIVTPSQPEEPIVQMMYELAEMLFSSGEDPAGEVSTKLPGYGQWEAERCASRFPPDRDILEVRPVPPSDGAA